MKKKITKKPKKKMPPKDLKVTDVAKPGRTAPPATARPIIVTNRPVLASDPMIVDSSDKEATARTAPLVSRTAKTIEPIAGVEAADPQADVTKDYVPDQRTSNESALAASPSLIEESRPISAADNAVSDSQPAGAAGVATESTDQPPEAFEPAPKATESAPEPSKPTKPPEEDVITTDDEDVTEKSEADISAADAEARAAEEARQQAFEKLAETGTYAVPINAVQRKRSRTFIATMCVIGLVLAVALADLVLDANLVQVPDSIPHTHFFSGN